MLLLVTLAVFASASAAPVDQPLAKDAKAALAIDDYPVVIYGDYDTIYYIQDPVVGNKDDEFLYPDRNYYLYWINSERLNDIQQMWK